MTISLSGIRLITFDVFGTLLDWRAPVESYFPGKFLQFSRVSETLQNQAGSGSLSYASHLKAVGFEINPAINAAELDRFSSEFGAAPAFPDVRALLDLRLLAQVGCISNSDMVHQHDVQRTLNFPWDLCLTVDQMKSWKPHSTAWDFALHHVQKVLGLEKSQWLHVSSFAFFDLEPCRQRGIQTCFIPRPGGGSAREAEIASPDLVVSDLFDLASRLQVAKDGPWRYRVMATCSDENIVRQFLHWMRYEHGADLLKITGCSEFRAFQINPLVVHCEYIFSTRHALDRYLGGAAKDLRLKGRELFDESEVSFQRDETRLVCQGVGRKKRDFAVPSS